MAHINHIRAVAGVEHVGIGDLADPVPTPVAYVAYVFPGGDYNGINVTPVGLEDVSHYPEVSDMPIL